MLIKNNPSADAPGGNREECYACYRAKVNCLCGSIKPVATKMRFVILMHTKEARKQKTGTARLAKLCLTNAELLIGMDFTHNERVNALLRDPGYSPYVLYPGPEAVNFKTMEKDLLPEGKTLLVFVIDGTWNCARSLLHRSLNVRALPRLSFYGNYISQFAIKRQPMQHCVSTIEAIYHLCNEAEEAGYEKLNEQNEILMDVFKKLVGTQLRYAKGKGRRREENMKKRDLKP